MHMNKIVVTYLISNKNRMRNNQYRVVNYFQLLNEN
jgi:hypothetical protein